MELLPSFIAVCIIALSHILAARVGPTGQGRHGFLSAAGGAAVAYVFIYILPKLSKQSHVVVDELGPGLLGLLDRHVYGVAMLGLIAYYGVNRLSDITEKNGRSRRPTAMARWAASLHVGSFAAYSLLVGFLIAKLGTPRIAHIALATLAMALHLLGNDRHLAEKYKATYHGVIRWVLAVSVLAGWLLGLALAASATLVAFGFAFLSGGIIINTLREELPHERHARFLPFLGGAVGYAILILLAIYAYKG